MIMLYKYLPFVISLSTVCSEAAIADTVPSLGKVLANVVELAQQTGPVCYKGSSELSIWDEKIQSWSSPPVDTIFSITFDGYFWGKFHATLNPIMAPWTNGAASFYAQDKEIAYDGEKVTEVVHRAGAPLDLKPQREGTIKQLDQSDFLSLFRVTGTEFSLYNLKLLSDKTVFEYPDLVNAVEGTIESTGALKGYIKYSLPFSGKGAKELIWVDPTNGFALKKYELELLDKDGKANGSLTTYTVSAYKKVMGTNAVVPSEMEYQMSSMGKNKWRYRIFVESAESIKLSHPDQFTIEFPAGTVMTDERLGVTFVVGKTKKAAIEAINESIQSK